MARPLLRLLRLRDTSIFDQLRLEEALLRADPGASNWLILNRGADPGLAVLGASGKPRELLNVRAMLDDGIPAVKRFSGGGTVFVDSGTLFATIIMNNVDAPPRPYPRDIMDWSAEVYREALARGSGVRSFHLRDNDYTVGDGDDGEGLKFGGNAQSIVRDRWLHHTSFLWEFDPDTMHRYLQMPKKMPDYRGDREHRSFLRPMHEFIDTPDTFFDSLVDELGTRYDVEETDVEAAWEAVEGLDHRRSNKVRGRCGGGAGEVRGRCEDVSGGRGLEVW